MKPKKHKNYEGSRGICENVWILFAGSRKTKNDEFEGCVKI